ncbi:hypothetical protein QVD17_38065 [Tagetes erecta]|uniref:O-fucosyltransferase family protein n=1 Tax=Tagetes erecta TaxID=13708 RepID=A0AAD8JXY8_TARER|nr:hypothetical protein QVD17_38065 [Tagetes erecta]
MKPFRSMFPLLENHSTVDSSNELKTTQGLTWSTVDYMVCLLSDTFMATYDGPSNFANNLSGHRFYSGFRTAIGKKGLAPVFIDREMGRIAGFEEAVLFTLQILFKVFYRFYKSVLYMWLFLSDMYGVPKRQVDGEPNGVEGGRSKRMVVAAD